MNSNNKAKTTANAGKRVDELIAVIEQKKGDIPTERKAAQELGRIGSKKAINYLISCLEKGPISEALDIYDILEKVGEKAVPQYMTYLDAHVMHPGKEGASNAVLNLMGRCSGEGFLLFLIGLYKNPNVGDSIKTAITGIFILATSYSHEVVRALIELIPSDDQDEPDLALHYAVMLVADIRYHDNLIPLFKAILRTKNPYWIAFRQEAADALKSIKALPPQ
jgi:HEAT repeat protein